MAEDQGRSQNRFDRRKVAMPPIEGVIDYTIPAPAPSDARPFAFWSLAVLSMVLAGGLMFGYELYQTQKQDLDRMQAQLEANESDVAGQLADARAELAKLQFNHAPNAQVQTGSDVVLTDQRDAAIASLSLARQRIAALQAELGAPATGRADLGEIISLDSEVGPSQKIEALALEVRLLARERDAARGQIDQLLSDLQTNGERASEGAIDDGRAAIEAQNATLEELNASLSSELELALNAKEMAQAELSELLDTQSIRREAQNGLEASSQEKTLEIEQLSNRLVEVEAEAASARDEVAVLNEEIAILQAENEDARIMATELDAQIEDWRIKADASANATDVLQAELETLRVTAIELEEANQANETLNIGLTQLQDEVETLRSERNQIQTDLASLKDDKLDQAGLAERFSNELERAQENLDAMGRELEAANQARDQAVAEVEKLQVELAENGKDESSSEARLLDLSQELATAKARIVALEALNKDEEPAQALSVSNTVAGDGALLDVNAELQELRERQKVLETVLTRFTPQPPTPAPR